MGGMVMSTSIHQAVKYSTCFIIDAIRKVHKFECEGRRGGKDEKVPLTRSHKRDCCVYIFRRCL
jgi:hypothetical protein